MKRFKNKFLKLIVHLVLCHTKKVVVISFITAMAALLIGSEMVRFDTDENSLVSEKQAYHKRYLDYLKNFGDQEYVYVVFESGENGQNEAIDALNALIKHLEKKPDLFKTLYYKDDFTILAQRFFLSLQREDLNNTLNQLSEQKEWLHSLSSLASLDDFLNFLTITLDKPLEELEASSHHLKQGFEILDTILTGLDKPSQLEKKLNWAGNHLKNNFYFDPNGYLFSSNGKLLFLAILPQKNFTKLNFIKDSITFLRDSIKSVKKSHPTIPIGITGLPVLQLDQALSTGTDSVWAGFISFLGVALLFPFFFKKYTYPLYALLCLLCGISWTYGFTGLTLGHLNLLSIVFAVILIGLGVDYGLHLLFRYQQEKTSGISPDKAMEKTLLTSCGAIMTGALTTAAAFFSALFTDFLGIQELGFIAGCGILFCFLSQILILPAMVLLKERKNPERIDVVMSTQNIIRKSLRYHPKLLIIALLITLLGIPWALQIKINHNILKLQDPTLESVRYEQKILQESDQATWYAVMLAKDLKTQAELVEKIKKLSSVGRVLAVSQFIPPDEKEKRTLLNSLDQFLALTPLAPSGRTVRPEKLKESLHQLEISLNVISNKAFQAGKTESIEQIESLIQKTHDLQSLLENPEDHTIQNMNLAQEIFLKKTTEFIELIKSNLNPPALKQEDLPHTLKHRLVGQDGRLAILIFPEKNIWNPTDLKQFVLELRSVDPLVTGTPIEVFESSRLLKKGFLLVAIMTLILVFALMYFEFRSLQLCFLATFPLVFGIYWLLVLMVLLGLDFNLANFFAMPILIGLGVDTGVHIVARYQETGNMDKALVKVAPGVILATLTTLVGFGALAFVRHVGLASYGKIMVLGSITCLLSALYVLPMMAHLPWLRRGRF